MMDRVREDVKHYCSRHKVLADLRFRLASGNLIKESEFWRNYLSYMNAKVTNPDCNGQCRNGSPPCEEVVVVGWWSILVMWDE
jgi:hypothetical protein